MPEDFMLFTKNSDMHTSTIRTRFFVTFLTLVIVGITGMAAFGQSGSVSAGAKKKVVKKKVMSEREREREREKQFKLKYNAAANAKAQRGPTLVPKMTFYGVSEPLSEIASRPQPEISKEDGPVFENEMEDVFEEPMKRARKAAAADPIQTIAGSELSAVIGANFTAVAAGGSAPPDTTLAVGPNHIIVWVNSRFSIFNKSGTILSGPTSGSALYAGMPNLCATTNRGDPILQYDRLADRWILSQFAFGSGTTAPYFQCFAVSTSGDPLGTYNKYSVEFSAVAPSGLNDYGKLGVMPEAYYTSYNMFQGSPAGSNSGSGLCASDRVKMLAGDPTATTLCAPIAVYAGGGSYLPADLDGTTLPTNSTQGGIFIRQNTAPLITLIKLKPNFAAGTVTINDGFGGAAGTSISVPIPTTLRACNGTGGTCIAQPGTTNLLDTLGGRLMYRAAYRNRGGVDSLVFAQTVDPDGAGTRGGAMRWYEIRDPFSATPTLFQVGTFDEGGTGDRWMGSIAMNKNGDMMMGYSIANSATGLKPSIGLTGRRASDPLNTMQAETIAFTGLGVQLTGLTRWGDYTTMQVDPSDDEGFCYVGQYLPADGTFNWTTRVVCAKFPASSVTISGRVLTAQGRGVRNAVVRLTLPDMTIRTVVSGPLGQFSFANVTTGQTYGLTATGRRFAFGTQNVSPTSGDVTGLTIVAQ
ncbi:MAG: carboxypeptidase regulatory-like domain-containing protein [Chloracidobacterium sp.]|nr:carboxypeptidase regulatory-like domain-containing protein [Chloracidobacterium sp.]